MESLNQTIPQGQSSKHGERLRDTLYQYINITQSTSHFSFIKKVISLKTRSKYIF